MNATNCRVLDTSSLPNPRLSSVHFPETSFFRCPRHDGSIPKLPTPAEVRAKAHNQIVGVVKFEELGLIVKFGLLARVRTEEALTLIAVRRAFPNNEVPVPEVFGWTTSNDQMFLYMSLMQGSTVQDRWPSLTEDDKNTVCHQLGQMVRSVRCLQSCHQEPFIGSIIGGHVQDIYFCLGHEAGPFANVAVFNDWVQYAALPMPMSERPPEPYRDLLPDTAGICFTHGDLNLGNILIEGESGAITISAILDWEQAGWYPEYWEYCKSLIAVPHSHEWRLSGFADRVMHCYEDEWIAFSEYWTWRQP